MRFVPQALTCRRDRLVAGVGTLRHQTITWVGSSVWLDEIKLLPWLSPRLRESFDLKCLIVLSALSVDLALPRAGRRHP